MLVEHARNVIGLHDAGHAESEAGGTSIITPLACSLDGRRIEVSVRAGTRLSALHAGAASVSELTTCNYGLDPSRQDIASQGGMLVSAVDDTGEVRAVERVDHPFFVATLYQPQLQSSADTPHPVWLGFARACHERSVSSGR